MKILVSTTQTQGLRTSDFSWTNDGEILTLGLTSDFDNNEPIDGGGGGRRSFVGIDTRKATTTAVVVETELTEEEVIFRLVASDVKAWRVDESDEAVMDELRMDAGDMIMIANKFNVGDIIEKRGDTLQVRPSKMH